MRLITGFIVLALIASALAVRPSAQSTDDGPAVSGEIIVKFRPGANANSKADAHREGRGRMRREIATASLQLVEVQRGDEAGALARYRRNPNVLYAERNFIRRIPKLVNHTPGSEVIPGDSLFSEQWALHNTGQEFLCLDWLFGDPFCFYQGMPDADIDAPEAWPLATGAGVTVAVIDTGIDYTHPDLASNYAGGVDFTSNDGDPFDDQGHGTHVSGTIAAAMNNPTGNPADDEGVVGVAPNARIRAYKVCRADGTCDDFAVELAIARAVSDGAKVINMSFGGADYSQSLNDVVQAAWNAGVVLVAGAGNDGTTDLFYPAALDHVVSVAAFDENGQRASFSNYGSWVDVSAPGNVIMSTYPMSTCDVSSMPGQIGCYTWLSGTSMATPHVSGAAALIWSRGDVTSNQQVVDILLNSADPVGVDPVRLDSWTIHGGLNVHNALSYGVTNLRPVASAGADQTVTDTNGDGVESVTLDGSASSDPDGSIVSYEWREGSTVLSLDASPSIFLSIGAHTLTLHVTDDGGATGTDTVVVTINSNFPKVSVTATTSQATEAGPAAGVFTVTRTGDLSAALIVNYTVAGTATAGADYAALSGSVSINAGAASATIPVTPIDDTAYESNETVAVTVSASASYTIGTPNTATVTIVSDDLPPDLIATVLSTSSIAGADTDIVINDSTKNQGTGASMPSSTGFYLSTNVSLDAADVFLGSRPVSALSPGATEAAQTTLHLPATTATGTYYVIAKTDWNGSVAENNENNNTRSSGAIKIGPDVVVSSLTAPTAAAAGSTFVVTEATKNQGGGGAPSTTTRFYLSGDVVLDASDVELGNRVVPILQPNATDQVNITLTLPAATATGSYYVIAQSDVTQVVLETIETNNSRTSAMLRVGPDLLVTGLTAPSVAGSGGAILVTDTTKNQGASPAAASVTSFYLSINATFDATDAFMGTRPVTALIAGGSETVTTSLQIPAGVVAGTYYVVAKADGSGSIAETIETNNERASTAIRIGGDLVLTAMTAPVSGNAGGVLTVSDTTKNQGGASAPETSTGFYLSANSAVDAADIFLGSRTVSALAAGGSQSGSTPLPIPAGTSPGNYYVIGVADWNDAVVESLENNNTRTSTLVRIGPDLIVTSLTAPASAVAGSTITGNDTTMNQSGDTTPASVTNYYLSLNATLDGGDVLIGTRQVLSLAPNASNAGAASLTIPASTAPGTYTIIAKADGNEAIVEAAETNNTRTKTITISAAP
jgi:subtilisin family serine protease/subtilase family serine protease